MWIWESCKPPNASERQAFTEDVPHRPRQPSFGEDVELALQTTNPRLCWRGVRRPILPSRLHKREPLPVGRLLFLSVSSPTRFQATMEGNKCAVIITYHVVYNLAA